MIQDETERDAALTALAEEISARTQTPIPEFVDQDEAFAAARAVVEAARKK